MEKISAEQVRAQVHKFWGILCGKSADRLERLYAPDGTVFTGRAKRTEPAALAAQAAVRGAARAPAVRVAGLASRMRAAEAAADRAATPADSPAADMMNANKLLTRFSWRWMASHQTNS